MASRVHLMPDGAPNQFVGGDTNAGTPGLLAPHRGAALDPAASASAGPDTVVPHPAPANR